MMPTHYHVSAKFPGGESIGCMLKKWGDLKEELCCDALPERRDVDRADDVSEEEIVEFVKQHNADAQVTVRWCDDKDCYFND
jgi:hypothetical protein